MATAQADADNAAAPLDQLLVDVGAGPLRRWLPGRPGVEFIASLAGKPRKVGRRVSTMVGELDRVVLDRSAVEPKRGDRRFADPAWTHNPWLRRLVQAYLATGDAVAGLVDDAALAWRSDQQIRFLAENLIEAISPSNVLLVNPASAKAVDTGGASIVRGARDLAKTPGAVVFRSPVLELIQYTPQTERVRSVPLLIVPPTINKFYVTDLAPGRSLIEYLVRSGQQVFVISWRNPRVGGAAWGMDTYGEAIVRALGAIGKICEIDRMLLLAACSGGIITSMLLGHLAARGRLDRIAGLSLLVTVLDQAKAGLSAAGVDNYVVAGAADHLCSGQNCYQSTRPLGGDSRFVLSTSGHIAAVRRSRARPNSALPGLLRWPTRPAPISSRAEISLAKTEKDLVAMSETPITQQAEAAVTRINQLTERMLTAARNAGGDLANAHEKALRSLADNPADLKQPVEWVQALAEVHAKFIEEATDGLVKTASEAASDVPVTGVLDEAAAQRIRSLNKQVLARASAAGAGAVDGYEKALQDMADFETKIAGSSQLDWLQAVARSHTKFVTDLVSMYANAIRNGLSG